MEMDWSSVYLLMQSAAIQGMQEHVHICLYCITHMKDSLQRQQYVSSAVRREDGKKQVWKKSLLGRGAQKRKEAEMYSIQLGNERML